MKWSMIDTIEKQSRIWPTLRNTWNTFWANPRKIVDKYLQN